MARLVGEAQVHRRRRRYLDLPSPLSSGDRSHPPRIQRGEHLLASAHGNPLRALTMALAGIEVGAMEGLEIRTATPMVQRCDRTAPPLGWRYLEAATAGDAA